MYFFIGDALDAESLSHPKATIEKEEWAAMAANEIRTASNSLWWSKVASIEAEQSIFHYKIKTPYTSHAYGMIFFKQLVQKLLILLKFIR